MKKHRIILYVTAIAVCLFCGSCGKKETKIFASPEKVTAEFVKAFYTADFDNIHKYTLETNGKLIRILEKNVSQEKKTTLMNNKVEVYDVACTFHNDSVAECLCRYSCNGKEQKMPVILKKSDGKWFVDLTI